MVNEDKNYFEQMFLERLLKGESETALADMVSDCLRSARVEKSKRDKEEAEKKNKETTLNELAKTILISLEQYVRLVNPEAFKTLTETENLTSDENIQKFRKEVDSSISMLASCSKLANELDQLWCVKPKKKTEKDADAALDKFLANFVD